MKVLAVDTASKSACVALHDGERLLGEFYIDSGLTHSATLMPVIESLLNASGTSISEIGLFAAAAGPGSFTGLRIGIACVKGMAFANNTPCVGVSTLRGLAYNLRGMDGIACAVMDARRSQVYNALFSLDSDLTRLTEDRAVSMDMLSRELGAIKEQVMLVGDGAELFYSRYGEGLPHVVMAAQERRMGRAGSIALIALKEYESSAFVSPDQLAPLYLRLPQAQRELMESIKHGRDS